MRYLDKSGLQYFGQKIKAALNGKSDNNHNHNANYAPLSHSNDGNIHVTSAQKTDWNSKATGSHNHNSNYAPIAHSNDGNIHVSASQKNDWNGKAAGGHGHTPSSIGAEPALGFTPVRQGGGIGQQGSRVYLGWSGHELKATVDETDLGVVMTERAGGARIGWSALWLGSGIHRLNLDKLYGVLIISTGVTTGTVGATNRAVVCGAWRNTDQWFYIVSTNTGHVKVAFKGDYILIDASVTEEFYLSYAAFA